MSNRLKKMREWLVEHDLDGVLISSDENRKYLSGFAGSAGYLIVSRDEAVLFTDFRYIEQASKQAPDFRVERISGDVKWLVEFALEKGLQRVSFESQHLTFHMYSLLKKAIGEVDNGSIDLVGMPEVVDSMRATKYEEEMALLEKAIAITDYALEKVSETLEPGITEREIAWQLEKTMRERGADGLAFDTIVASGPNGALPHHSPSDRPIMKDEPVVIDMGAKYRGYCADLTRTVLVGDSDDVFCQIYNTVLRAQESAIDGVHSGMTGAEVDSIARKVIQENGHGDNFGHSLGHGVGLAVHELPRVSPKSDDVLKDGMVFTIEPGIYIPEWGGVRIEDVVVLQEGDAKVISKASKINLQ